MLDILDTDMSHQFKEYVRNFDGESVWINDYAKWYIVSNKNHELYGEVLRIHFVFGSDVRLWFKGKEIEIYSSNLDYYHGIITEEMQLRSLNLYFGYDIKS
ncbi:hypothetical protein FLAPJACK_13 [Bacillus phage Flapjack]|uniref:Uncharacterized protein n=1 Tax=Bacillus phage Flapjack TaxID=1983465 RepID=A0A1X9SFZ5_9CAUD|nr:hypothetical protein FLAPJACK_13 [Bacillus phage Flapjack]